MQFTTAISALIAVAAAATASPTYGLDVVPVPEGYFEAHLGETGVSLSPAAAVHRRLSVRATTHVFVCINANFNPACSNIQLPTNTCFNFVGNFNDAITSIGPDKGTTCTIWFDNGCRGRSVGGIVNPGIKNLNDFNFNDVASSVRCV